VADYDACANGVARIIADIGPVSVLVNNAGTVQRGWLQDQTPESWKRVLDVNLNGVFNMTHIVWPGMRARRFGRIISISSVNGQKGQVRHVNLCAAKSAVIGMMKSLALEGASYGITANSIAPGYVDTDVISGIPKEEITSRVIPVIPVGRIATPSEIARAVVFLADDAAGFITGATLSINGGQYPA
jgi:acetoacetyl-CoA reductase